MKLRLDLVEKHAERLLSEQKAGTLKSKIEKVTGRGKPVLLWTGRCQRAPGTSVLARLAQKKGVKKIVMVCPVASKHVYTVVLDAKKGSAKAVDAKVYYVRP